MKDDADFEGLLKQSIGLDAASIGSAAVERAVQAREAACESQDACAYWDLVRTSASEHQALIDAVVVPETWFFRDREAYSALLRVAQGEWLQSHPQGVMRLLSLPCSSGEEPYSLAMTLLDGGFSQDRYCIDAADVSTRLLAQARCAVYGRNSFRGGELEFRKHHFDANGDGYRLHDSVRRRVRFHHANLFAAESVLGTQRYDAIFCRNLLIYFDRITQVRAVQMLGRLLAPEGVLFVGPSESGLLMNLEFSSIKVPLAFAFRKGLAVPQTNARAPSRRPRRPQIAPRSAASAAPPSVPAAAAETATVHAASLGDAGRLADQGRLTEAQEHCQAHLRVHGPSAEVFQLMGLLHTAVGNLITADEYYRKALYLDPSNYDTLVHLAWLLEKLGDDAGVRVLRGRVSRLERQLAK